MVESTSRLLVLFGNEAHFRINASAYASAVNPGGKTDSNLFFVASAKRLACERVLAGEFVETVSPTALPWGSL